MLVLCSGVWYGRDLYLCILLRPDLCSGIMLPPDLCSGISLGPDLCPRIVYRPDVSVLFHGPDLCSGILHGLHGPDLCLCIFLCRPSLELLEQGFRWWLPDFGLTLISSFKSGSSVVARRRILCCRRQSLSVGG